MNVLVIGFIVNTWYVIWLRVNHYRPQTKLRQGKIFISVCQEFCHRGARAWWGGACVTGCVAGEMATVAGGTHPTGMHSCLVGSISFNLISWDCNRSWERCHYPVGNIILGVFLLEQYR